MGKQKAYDPQSRPSQHSTPLARFCSPRPAIPADAPVELTAFAEARCEILSDDIPLPIRMATSDDIVAVIGAGGWKQRTPTMLIQRLSIVPEAARIRDWNKFATVSPNVGLSNVAHALRVDASRQLVWVGDEERIKSYKWSYDETDTNEETLPVHTLMSNEFSNAILLREGGARVFRSGRRGMAIWDVTSLPTHGRQGTKIIGKKMRRDSDFGSRDDTEDIERSEGTLPTTTMDGKPVANIVVAENHPNGGSQILGVHRADHRGATSVAAVDLETQQFAMRYLGHGADINGIATTSGDGDPNGFVTVASDGGVRLYDVRQPTPQFAIEHGDEKLHAALYEYIGGQPFIIYGTLKSQQIKVWDVRNRAPLYELATGNNSVSDLAWDAPRQTLLAVTECDSMDRNGTVHDYRWARIRKHGQEWLRTDGEENDDENMEEDDSDEDSQGSEDYDEEYGWPNDAWHNEKSFGVAFDAGDHRIFRYQFKSDANPKILPEYGQATPGQEDYY
ncbi:WD40 repeat-like protein [Mycena amicta]|nr:WD40 repeat-like protein [Mycena amicta]